MLQCRMHLGALRELTPTVSLRSHTVVFASFASSSLCSYRHLTACLSHVGLSPVLPSIPRITIPLSVLFNQQIFCGDYSRLVQLPAGFSRKNLRGLLMRDSFYRPDSIPAIQPSASKRWKTNKCAVHVVQKSNVCQLNSTASHLLSVTTTIISRNSVRQLITPVSSPNIICGRFVAARVRRAASARSNDIKESR